MKVRFYGTGSAVPSPERFRSSLLVEAGGGGFLLPDCGELVSTGIVRDGIAPDEISGAVVTHMHADHIAGLPTLLQYFQLRGRRAPFPLFLPREGLEATRRFLRAVYLGRELLPFRLETHPIPAGKSECIGPFTVSFFGNRHLRAQAKAAHRPGESYSLRIGDGVRQLVYSGDVASLEELHEPLAHGADALILECAHWQSEEAGRFAASAEVPPHVALTHFHPKIATTAPPPIPGWVCARDGMHWQF